MLSGRLKKLEDTFGMNRIPADGFELSRPEVLGIIALLMVCPSSEFGVTEEQGERLQRLLERHKRNTLKKYGTDRTPSLPEIFEAVHNGEKFCDDIDPVLERAMACGIIRKTTI